MEVRGEDFIKNLEIEREKARLREQTAYLNRQKEPAVIFNSNSATNKTNDFDNELDDIVLEDKKSNKQKYIVLVFVLILLFLITLIIIRLLGQANNDNSFPDNDFIQNNNKVDDIYTQEDTSRKDITKGLSIENMQAIEEENNSANKEEEEEKKVENLKSDIFEMNSNVKAKEIQEKPLESLSVKKEFTPTPIPRKIQVQETTINNEPKKLKDLFQAEKKVIVKEKTPKIQAPKKEIIARVKPPKKEALSSKSKIVDAFYIQVGAFTKEPNPKLIVKLKNSKHKFIYHKMTIKGRNYTKVLVGPFKSRPIALESLEDVKSISKNKSAYIARFK